MSIPEKKLEKPDGTDIDVSDVDVPGADGTDVEVTDVHENGGRARVKASRKARRGVPGGPAKQNGFGADRLDAIRKVLQKKRSDLVDQQATQLNALYAPDKHHLADLEEMASDTTDTDSLCAIVDLGSSTIEQIDGAIERIGDGTYGICERCEEPIDPDRLEVLPFA
ncbi:MAG TPA: TraR/DksA family transcriptional regulator, partial [Planctomycetota bacterium]|nr:TraR/DksA family transcriptional regulator [Planctomycetota bacterium]